MTRSIALAVPPSRRHPAPGPGRRRFGGAILAALLALSPGLGGCVTPILPGAPHVSTKHAAVPAAYQSLGLVRTTRCGVVVTVFPVIEPIDPVDAYAALMEKAESLRADAVVDFRERGSDLAGFYPFFVRGCVEYVGTAVRFRR